MSHSGKCSTGQASLGRACRAPRGLLPSWFDGDDVRGASVIKFRYHGRTYYKIFYFVIGAVWAGVDCVEHIVE